MPATPLEISAASQLAMLLTFTHGAEESPSVHRYCRWTSSLTIGSENFVAEPTAEDKLGANHGGTEDRGSSLTISSRIPPVDRLILPYQHSPTWVKIEAIDPSNIATRRRKYEGLVVKATRSPDGRPGLARLELAGVKSFLKELKISLPLLSKCINRFGDRVCRVNPSAWTRTGTVTSVWSPTRTSVVLALSGISDPPTDLANDRYENGAVVVDGLAITIVRSNENSTFDLTHTPPPYWVGRPVKVLAGCTRQLIKCRMWNAENNFRALGCKLVARNPVFELPPA